MTAELRVADFDNDQNVDLVISGDDTSVHVFAGNGDGTFTRRGVFESDRDGHALDVADLNNDGNLDLVVTGTKEDRNARVHLGNGDGTFTELLNPATGAPGFRTGQWTMAVALADFGSEAIGSDSSRIHGPPDGHLDIIVANAGIVLGVGSVGGEEVAVVPAQVDQQGNLIGYGLPIQLTPAKLPESLAVGDVNHDGAVGDQDAVLTERGDDPAITGLLTDQMLSSLDPALGPFGQRPTALLGIWLDPVSMDLRDPNGDHITYNLKDDTLIVDRDDCFVLVIWNIELIICPVFGGQFTLDVDDVPESARGGVLILRQNDNETKSITDELRSGVARFTIEI